MCSNRGDLNAISEIKWFYLSSYLLFSAELFIV
jgi:hypothetical protein